MNNTTNNNDKLELTEIETLLIFYVALCLALSFIRLKTLSIKG